MVPLEYPFYVLPLPSVRLPDRRRDGLVEPEDLKQDAQEYGQRSEGDQCGHGVRGIVVREIAQGTDGFLIVVEGLPANRPGKVRENRPYCEGLDDREQENQEAAVEGRPVWVTRAKASW